MTAVSSLRRCGLLAAVAWLVLLVQMAGGAQAVPSTEAASAAAERLVQIEWQGRARPREAALELESLLERLPQDPALRIEALRVLGWLKASVPDADAAERVAQQLDALAQRDSAPAAQAAAGFVRARVHYRGSLARADRLLSEAISRLPDSTPPIVRLRYLVLHGRIKERGAKLEDAVRIQQEALRTADALAEPWQRSELRSDLAYTLYLAEQPARGREINAEALMLARRAGDELALARAWTTEAILLTSERDDNALLQAWQAAISHARTAGSKADEVLGLANIADYYLTRGHYTTALQSSEQALLLAREQRDVNAESLALSNVGMSQIALGRKADGLKHVRMAMAMEERAGSLASMVSLHGELGDYLEKAGFLKDALEAFHEHRRMADEVFQQDQQQAIVELQEGFDHERRQRELTLLERENRLKQEQLLNRELQQRLWAAAAAAGVLLVCMAGVLYRRARASNAQLSSSNEQLAWLSERDPLTGLANRRHLQNVLRQRAGDGSLAGTVFMIDIDHFKRVNDRFGHAAGDAVLVEMARRLRATLRDDDLVVRWGGEEFLVVVRSMSPEQVEALALRLLGTLAAPLDGTPRGMPVSASIGFASFPLDPGMPPVPWERAIDLVDAAMYLAKAHGRNRAYGVRLRSADAAALEQIIPRLESAAHNGEASLIRLLGPAPLVVGVAA